MTDNEKLQRIVDTMDCLDAEKAIAKQNRRGSRDPLKNIEDIKRQRRDRQRQESAKRLRETF